MVLSSDPKKVFLFAISGDGVFFLNTDSNNINSEIDLNIYVESSCVFCYMHHFGVMHI